MRPASKLGTPLRKHIMSFVLAEKIAISFPQNMGICVPERESKAVPDSLI